MKVKPVKGIVIAQYSVNCGLMPNPMELELVPSQLKKGAEKSVARKLPGRNNRAPKARTFMEDESCKFDNAVTWDARAVCRPMELSFCAMRLNI